MWNTQSTHVVRTLDTGFGLSVLFAPGDKHLIVGTKKGKVGCCGVYWSKLDFACFLESSIESNLFSEIPS